MKFGRLIEYNMRNAFLKNHTQTIPRQRQPDKKVVSMQGPTIGCKQITGY